MSSFFMTVCRAKAIASNSAGSACSAAWLVLALVAALSASTAASQSRVVGEGVHTDAPATRGQGIYNQRCASCHGDKLETAGLKQITWPVSSTISANASAQAASGAAPQTPAWALTGNLQQLMRGAFFQNSNIIFNVQTHDPGEKIDPAGKRAGAGIDWVGWGSGLYTGWEAVDYAAISLAEVTPLLLTPGRRCQNGKPVPVDRADWIKFTMDMLEAARKSYKASQTRNQEAVSDSTNDLSDACLACHQVYRDKRAPGGQPGDPTSMALRCTP